MKKILLLLMFVLSLHANIMEDIERFNTLLKEAKEGDTLSQFWVAERYLKGNGTQQDLQNAVYWYEKSAKKGYIKSIMIIGKIYTQAGKNEQGVQEGVHYYETLAYYGKSFPDLVQESSDYQAKYRIQAFKNLMSLYDKGSKHLKADKTKATKYFKELQEFQKRYAFAKFLDTAGLYYQKAKDTKRQEVLLALLEEGCDVNATYEKEKDESYSLLFYSIVKNNHKLFNTLIEKGANLNYTNEKGKNAFYIAIQYRNLELAKRLQEKGIKLDHNATTQNPLVVAAYYRDKELTKYLVSIGYRPKKPILKNKNLLDFVLIKGDEKSVEYLEWILKNYDFNLNKKHYIHEVSMKYDMTKKIQLLLKYGADKTLKNDDGYTAKELYAKMIQENKKLITKYENSTKNKVKVVTSENKSIQSIVDNAFGEKYYYVDKVLKKWNKNLNGAIEILEDI